VALPLAYAVLVVQQSRLLAAKPETRARLKTKLEPLRALIPGTAREFRLFIPLSITAGVCEELLFRGYLVWVLRSWIGLWPAAIVSMAAFGLGHAYQGAKFGLRAFWAGVAMGLLAIFTGSIVPGMVLHALIDVGSGWILYSTVRDSEGGSAEPAAVGAA
jgi:membrane protease YdiL (CAAX protease family)